MIVMFISLKITALTGLFMLLGSLFLTTVCFYGMMDGKRSFREADKETDLPEAINESK